jgi:hypothetical protein
MTTEGQKKFGAGILVGVLLTVVCLGGLILFAMMRTPSVEDVLKTSVQKQSTEEQARLGIDCRTVDAELQKYLSSQGIVALAGQHKNLAEWKQSLTPSVAEQTATVTDLIGTCARLYKRGEMGKLNGLDHLRFATFEVYGDLALVNAALKYTPWDRCDDGCLRNIRSTIQEPIANLQKRVRDSNAQSNPTPQADARAATQLGPTSQSRAVGRER